jgi:hypothetical protein
MTLAQTRVAVTTVALLMIAWLAVGLHSAHNQQRAYHLIFAKPHLSRSDVARARHLLAAAEWLNPDTELEVFRTFLLVRTGHRREGARVLEDVVRREPANIDAWARLKLTVLPFDPKLAARADAHVRSLVSRTRR